MGIARHSQVRIAGIPVGTIRTIRLEDNQARVDIRLNPEITLFDDATASKVTASLLGEYVLTLTSGTEGAKTPGRR